jgi:hypothetical protein
MATETDYAREQAAAQLASIVEMISPALRGRRWRAIEAIQEHPLEIGVRQGWHVEKLSDVWPGMTTCQNCGRQTVRYWWNTTWTTSLKRMYKEREFWRSNSASGWGDDPGGMVESDNVEYAIELTTARPAVRIIGNCESGKPISASFEYQDWGTPWTRYHTTSDEDAALMAYAAQFYYGG